MRDLLNGIYNKVISFFSASKEEGENASKEQAYNRLKLVLMHDRAGLSEGTLQMMRSELIEVISKYMEIDTEALDLKLETEGESIALMLGIPVIRAKSEEEIQQAVDASKEDELNTCDKVDEAAENETGAEEASDCTEASDTNEDASGNNVDCAENEKNEQSDIDEEEKTEKKSSSKKSKKKNK